jgi:uncharacterized membrane protein
LGDFSHSLDSVTLRASYEAIKARFWIIPAIIVLLGILLAMFVQFIPIGLRLPQPLSGIVFDASSENSRQILSAIATALMTVVGVLFSVVVVVLQQISAQYNPRVIEKFIRSGLSQAVLGMFIGTFVYCLLVLKQVPVDPRDSQDLPHLGINLGIIGAIACMMLLINYIHHIVYSIRAGRVVNQIHDEAIISLASYLKTLSESGKTMDSPATNCFENTYEICSRKTGFMQEYNIEALKKNLKGKRFHCRLDVLPGDYIRPGARFASLQTAAPLEEGVLQNLGDCFQVGEFRTHEQDVRLGVRQLADIALRALSPSMNDPTTATEALQAAGSVLIHFLRHCDLPRLLEFDDGSTLQLRSIRLKSLLALAFSECFLAAKDQLAVLQVIETAHLDLLTCARQAEDLIAIKEGLEQIRLRMSNARMNLHYHSVETTQPQLTDSHEGV